MSFTRTPGWRSGTGGKVAGSGPLYRTPIADPYYFPKILLSGTPLTHCLEDVPDKRKWMAALAIQYNSSRSARFAVRFTIHIHLPDLYNFAASHLDRGPFEKIASLYSYYTRIYTRRAAAAAPAVNRNALIDREIIWISRRRVITPVTAACLCLSVVIIALRFPRSFLAIEK